MVSALFELTEDTGVELKRVDGDRVINISATGRSLFHWRYHPRAIDPPLSVDSNAFVEEEDFDFCLFVFHVANDRERRTTIYS